MSVKMNLLLVYIVCLARFEFAIESDLCKNISDVQTDLVHLSDAPVSQIQLIGTFIIHCVPVTYRKGRPAITI
jgi:hypothetical protein